MQSKEIVELIKAKKASAEADYKHQKDVKEKLYILGELDAYQDLLIAIEQKEIKEATADTDNILANRIITNLKTSDDQLETVIKFLLLPKESQEKILKNLTITAQKVFNFIQQELGTDAVIKALEAKKRAKNTLNT